jgi:hypothetical protein
MSLSAALYNSIIEADYLSWSSFCYYKQNTQDQVIYKEQTFTWFQVLEACKSKSLVLAYCKKALLLHQNMAEDVTWQDRSSMQT